MIWNADFGMWVSGFVVKCSRLSVLKSFLIILLFLFFKPVSAQEFFTDLEDSVYSKQWINLKIIDSVQGHSGSHFSIADPGFQFGLGVESPFPEEVRGKNVNMLVDGWVKSDVPGDHALFVITLQNEEATVFWKAINLKDLLVEKETWTNFSETILVPGSVTSKGIVKAYLWNDDNKDTIAIDDLRFSFDVLPNQTFLPDIEISLSTTVSPGGQVLMENSFYKILYDEKNKRISLTDTSGKTLIQEVVYFEEVDTQPVRSLDLELKSVKNKKDGKVLLFSLNSESGDGELEMICLIDSSEIEINIEKKFNTYQVVERESLVLKSAVKTEKVFRSNRKIDTSDFQIEYWLDKQGAQFGIGSSSWIIYHTPGVSSMQLNTDENQLWINLDYEKDHPFLHFPIDVDTFDLKVDQSRSYYKKGEIRESSFSIYVGDAPKKLPRLMKNPSGFLATYIWTEHADFTDIRTNRATYFGSEKISDADSATGGFVKYGIPVTKSVFYFNPNKITNEEISDGKFTGLESTILSDNSFEDFLLQIADKGNEICLHTPEQFTSTKKAMKKSLKYMEKAFASPTWIDHGYNNGPKNNREDLACDGAIEGSENYSAKLWNKKGINYFWNSYYEDFYTFDQWQFGEMLSKPFYGFGDQIPDPDYWMHPSRTGSLWHWPTKSVLYVERDDLWEFYFSDVILNDFVNSWSVQFNHCYPAWVDPEKGFWHYEENGIIKARSGFNRTLEKMAQLRAEGLLNIPTVQTYLDYRLAIEKVDYQILTDGSLRVTNTGDKNISGLSFAVMAQNVLVDGLKPEQKIVDEDLVFWFDLMAGESKIIRATD